MLFKKRKRKRELEAKARAADRKLVENYYDACIQSAAEIDDPAKKIITLREIEILLDNKISTHQNSIAKEAPSEESKFLYSTPGIAPGSSVCSPGMGSASLAFALSEMRKESRRAELEAELSGHIENLRDIKSLVSVMQEITAKEHAPEITASPLYEKVQNLPGLKGVFAEAVKNQRAAAPAAPRKKSAPRKKKQPDYKDLNGL